MSTEGGSQTEGATGSKRFEFFMWYRPKLASSALAPQQRLFKKTVDIHGKETIIRFDTEEARVPD